MTRYGRGNAYGGTDHGVFTVRVTMNPEAKNALNRGIYRGLERCAEELKLAWADNLPGRIGSSVRVDMGDGSSGRATVGAHDYRARFFESGARRHTIRPAAVAAGYSVARAAYRKGLRGKARKELRLSVTAGLLAAGSSPVLRVMAWGPAGYATKLKHPGFPATRPGRNALREVLPLMPEIMAAEIARAL